MAEQLFVGIESSDRRVVCGVGCTWWDNIQKVAPIPGMRGSHGKPLPGCPHCHGVLFQFDDMDHWMRRCKEFEDAGHHGYVEFITWLRGQCFSSMQLALSEYLIKTGKTVNMGFKQ